jgi:hypothetical protein
MQAYESSMFDPPAPVARVVLRNPATGTVWSDVPMLLDSGADVTLIPEAVLRRLSLEVVPGKQYELSGFDGSVSQTSVARLEMVFCHKTFRGQFLLVDQDWGILGRNILNAVALLLDGPHLTWDEERR